MEYTERKIGEVSQEKLTTSKETIKAKTSYYGRIHGWDLKDYEKELARFKRVIGDSKVVNTLKREDLNMLEIKEVD